MSEKKFEECSLEEATHFEWENTYIPIELLPILGIKTFKKVKPIEILEDEK